MFRCFLGGLKTPKGHFEINWPLVQYNENQQNILRKRNRLEIRRLLQKSFHPILGLRDIEKQETARLILKELQNRKLINSKQALMINEHGEFVPDKAQYSTPNFFDRLFLIRAYWNPKFRQGPGLGGLSRRGGPEHNLRFYSVWDRLGLIEIA